jgi:sphingomyelin phosphodiesterase acid-like 3
MKNYFFDRTFILLFFLSLIFSFNSYAQAPAQKCLIVSDIHFNPLYGTPTDTALKRKLQNSSIDKWKGFFESSAPQMTVNSSLLYQDANFGVLQSAILNMKRKLPHPAFIIIAGDFIWHNATPADSVLKKKTIQFIAGLFKKHFPGTTIIPAMGNNDTYGDDYALQDSKFLNDFADAWSPNLPAAAAGMLKAQGYYSINKGSLKFIVINSAPLSYGSQYQQQAGAMFTWLQTNLSGAAGKNVWIVMHIPPGLNGYNDSNMWNPDFTQAFVNAIVKYSPKVKFMIASHTHFNDFKVFYNQASRPVNFMRIVPSICSNHGNYPSFEIAEFSHVTGRVIKEANWYLNLAAVPPKANGAPAWNSSVSLPEDLGLSSINAEGFSNLINNIKSDKSGQMLKKYVRFYNIGTPIDSSSTINSNNIMNYLKADSLKSK